MLARRVEEVVRGEEREVAAEVAVPLDDVERMLGHVLLVTREDDEVVERASRRRRDALEVVVGEEIGLSTGAAPPSGGTRGRSPW